MKVGLVGMVPVVETLTENDARQGFVNEADFQSLPGAARVLAAAGGGCLYHGLEEAGGRWSNWPRSSGG